MGSDSSLGPITPEGLPFDAAYRELVRFLALRKTRDPDLLLGMLDRDADLRLVRTADRAVHYVLAENLDAFQKSHQVLEERPAWDGGLRGVLTAQRAREEGFCKRTADSPAELAALYRIAGQSAVDDPTLGQLIRPVWIHLEGPLDAVMVAHLTKRVEQARQEKANLLILQINSPGGSRLGGRRAGGPAVADQGHEDGGLRRGPGGGPGGVGAAGLPRHRAEEVGAAGRRAAGDRAAAAASRTTWAPGRSRAWPTRRRCGRGCGAIPRRWPAPWWTRAWR